MNQISVQSYNPFEHLYPNRKVITREHLDFIKKLRSEGYDVQIKPSEISKLHFITRKGEWDFLSDPLFIYTSNAFLTIVLNILSNWIYDKINSRKKTAIHPKIIIESRDGDKVFRYSLTGELIDEKMFKNIMNHLEEKESINKTLINLKTDDNEYVWPIFLNHTNKHIGWAKVWDDEIGLATSAKIFDMKVFEKIESGELKGLSITGIVNDSECSICGNDYTECNHIGQKVYDGSKCTVNLKEIDLCELHVVETHVNPLAKIQYVAKK